MRRKCRYIAVLCAAACVGAGAPAQAFAQEAGGADCAGTEVTFTAGNDGAMTAAAESGKIAPVKYEKGSYMVGRDIPAGEYAVFAFPEGDRQPPTAPAALPYIKMIRMRSGLEPSALNTTVW